MKEGEIKELGKIVESLSAKKPGLVTIVITVGPKIGDYAQDLTYAPSRVHLKRVVDSVQWALSGGGPFRIEFEPGDSPFEQEVFTEKSGPAKVRPNAKWDYPFHYNLVQARGVPFEKYKRCPEIIIQR